MIFTSEYLRGKLREQPFLPFSVETTTGRHYDITHPDLMIVGRQWVEIAVLPSGPDSFPEQSARVALVHIVELRDLPTPAQSPPTNGAA